VKTNAVGMTHNGPHFKLDLLTAALDTEGATGLARLAADLRAAFTPIGPIVLSPEVKVQSDEREFIEILRR
jgi:hypothetical protein